MAFSKEADFEQALIDLLKTKGWEDRVLKNYSEAELIRNWADILFENNRGIDRLNDFPLTDGEMQQIIEQIPVISVHGLRHTHASVLLFAGVSIGSVARRLGHASMTTTQKTYLHIIHELENQDVDLVMRSLSSLC